MKCYSSAKSLYYYVSGNTTNKKNTQSAIIKAIVIRVFSSLIVLLAGQKLSSSGPSPLSVQGQNRENDPKPRSRFKQSVPKVELNSIVHTTEFDNLIWFIFVAPIRIIQTPCASRWESSLFLFWGWSKRVAKFCGLRHQIWLVLLKTSALESWDTIQWFIELKSCTNV